MSASWEEKTAGMSILAVKIYIIDIKSKYYVYRFECYIYNYIYQNELFGNQK